MAPLVMKPKSCARYLMFTSIMIQCIAYKIQRLLKSLCVITFLVKSPSWDHHLFSEPQFPVNSTLGTSISLLYKNYMKLQLILCICAEKISNYRSEPWLSLRFFLVFINNRKELRALRFNWRCKHSDSFKPSIVIPILLISPATDKYLHAFFSCSFEPL